MKLYYRLSNLAIIIAMSAILFSCSGGAKTNEETDKLKAENEQLKKDLNERDESVNEFMKSFNEIEESLLTVQGKENQLSSGKLQNSAEVGVDSKTRIEAEIQSINEMMNNSKNKIAELQKKLKKSNMKVSEFEKTIERLNQMIAERDAEIAGLNEKLIALNYQVESLNKDVSSLKSENESKDKEITQKADEMSIAYYAVGTKKELTDNGVITKDGEFSGSVKGNKALNYDAKYFTKIDTRNVSEITVGGKKAKILTSHPSSSFDLTPQKLTIKDANAFWKASKYCVVEVTK